MTRTTGAWSFALEPSLTMINWTRYCMLDFINFELEAVSLHYANITMQYTAIFHGCKNDNFQLKVFDYFHNFAQNIDCWYMLESPH